MNENKINVIFNTLAQKHMKEIYKMRKANDENGLYDLQEKLFAQAQEMAAKQPEFHFTPEQIEAYTTVGGTLLPVLKTVTLTIRKLLSINSSNTPDVLSFRWKRQHATHCRAMLILYKFSLFNINAAIS